VKRNKWRSALARTKKATIRDKLINTRQNLLSLVQGLDEDGWQTAVFSEETSWTVRDLLYHLADSERSMTRLMMQIREGGEGVPADFDLNRWNARVAKRSKDRTPATLLGDMAENQAQLLQFVDSLEEADWAKQGRHGSLHIMSIEEICHLIADHERTHTEHMRQALA
jgi:hypothetical protein